MPTGFIKSNDKLNGEDTETKKDATVEAQDMIGRTFLMDPLEDGQRLMLHDVRDQDERPQTQGVPGMAFSTVGGTGTGQAGGGGLTGGGGARIAGSTSQPNPRPDVKCNKCGKYGHFMDKCLEASHANGTTLVVVTDSTEMSAVTGTEGESTAGEGTALVTLGAPDEAVEGFQFLNHGSAKGVEFTLDTKLLSQHKAATGQVVPRSWILLDNQSTVDVFSNRDLLVNIRKAQNVCKISCNAGVVVTDQIGDLPGYPAPVWFHPNGMANILSLYRVGQHCRVQYDSEGYGGAFRVMKPDGGCREFKASVSGLHYCDTQEFGTVLINTVDNKKSKYTARAYKQAMLARRIQDMIGRPWTRNYTNIVDGGMIRNCPLVRADVSAAEDILGPNLGSLKGKTVRQKNMWAKSVVTDVPYSIIKLHRDVTLCFDIMFVNKIALLVTVSRNIRFGTTERLVSRHADVVGKAMLTVLAFYRQRGFRVKECHGDNEFEPLRATLADAGSHLNVTSEDENVPKIERYIRTIKERCRATYNTVPFKKMPGMMIVELIHSCNFWLNMFPARDGVSARQSLRQIMTGQQCDFNVHCQL
jgi:hypothetical protein